MTGKFLEHCSCWEYWRIWIDFKFCRQDLTSRLILPRSGGNFFKVDSDASEGEKQCLIFLNLKALLNENVLIIYQTNFLAEKDHRISWYLWYLAICSILRNMCFLFREFFPFLFLCFRFPSVRFIFFPFLSCLHFFSFPFLPSLLFFLVTASIFPFLIQYFFLLLPHSSHISMHQFV